MAMRKIFLCFAAIALPIAFSCTKDTFSGKTEEEGTVIDKPSGGLVYSQDLVSMTFTADLGTKTTLNGTAVSWAEGDEIEIYWGTESGDHTTATAVITDGKARFSAEVGETGPYYAVYPASTAAEFMPAASAEENPTFKIVVPQQQSGKFEDVAIVTSYTTAEQLNFGEFKSAVSLVKFNISNPSVTRVAFVPYSCNPSVGKVTVDSGKNVSVASGDASQGVITLNAISGEGTYFLSMLPDVQIDGVGFRIGTGTEWLGVCAKKQADLTLARNEILSVSTAIDTKIHNGDWYITPEGAGLKDGSSWENAGDADMFFSLMAYNYNQPASQAFASWRSNGHSIFLGTGEYKNFMPTAGTRCSIYTNLLESTPVIDIRGGYDATNGEKSQTEQTVFNAELGSESYTGFFKFNTGCFASLKIDGITFKNGQVPNQGGALWIGCPAEISNCSFIACKQTGTESSSVGGGALYVSEATTIENCTFDNCISSTSGGALYVAGKVAEVRGCSFNANATTSKTADKTGGAIYVGGSASINLDACTFEANKTAVTGGGALAFYSTAISTILNCRFNGNNPDKKGSNGGAILQKQASSTLYVANCSFDGNACATNGADIFTSKGNALLLYNCTSRGQINTASVSLGSVRANCPVLVANSSLYTGSAGTTHGVLCFGTNNTDSEEKNVIVNSIFLCDKADGPSFGTGSTSATRTIASYGHNLYSTTSKVTVKDKGSATDVKSKTAGDVGLSTELSSEGQLVWAGPDDSFTKATASEIETVLNAFAYGGAAFCDWLKTKGIFGKDASGYDRGDTWWPGSYQR